MKNHYITLDILGMSYRQCVSEPESSQQTYRMVFLIKKTVILKNFRRLTEDQGCPLVQKKYGSLLVSIPNRDSNDSRNTINI